MLLQGFHVDFGVRFVVVKFGLYPVFPLEQSTDRNAKPFTGLTKGKRIPLFYFKYVPAKI
jgi:hypothetical protein